MITTLSRRIKRRLFRRDYDRMARAVAAGKYDLAADLAWLLGEQELMRRYEALGQTKRAMFWTAPVADNPFARCSLEYRLRERRN